jgi:hypothetical protein
MQKKLRDFLADEAGLETAECALLIVFAGLAAIMFVPNSEELINRTVDQYSRILFHN